MGKTVDGRAEFDEREAEGAAGDDEREYRPHGLLQWSRRNLALCLRQLEW